MYSKFPFKNFFPALIAMFALTITSCNSNETNTSTETSDTTAAMSDTTSATNEVSNQTGNMAEAVLSGTQQDTTVTGMVRFNEENGKVKMTLDIMVPKKANQSVAVHLHEHGACGDAGKEAHGHWNPTNEPHGKWGSGAFHSGDIGNVQLDANGSGSLTLSTNRWTIGGDEKTNILNRAIIVHSGVDDYKTQPTGNAGSRIGCGVIMSK